MLTLLKFWTVVKWLRRHVWLGLLIAFEQPLCWLISLMCVHVHVKEKRRQFGAVVMQYRGKSGGR